MSSSDWFSFWNLHIFRNFNVHDWIYAFYAENGSNIGNKYLKNLNAVVLLQFGRHQRTVIRVIVIDGYVLIGYLARVTIVSIFVFRVAIL